jgi:UDP-N-acetylmuramoyl-L-alanyl-D-glutamate--2,6-diaminopimelate ligase
MILGVMPDHAMRLSKLLKAISPLSVDGSVEMEIAGIAYDSRRVRPGMLFVAIPGAQQDGCHFIDDAIERGAVAVVSERESLGRRDVSHIQVRSARQALAEMAADYYGHPSRELKTVGITGTNGKTTTAFMLREMLSKAGQNPGLISTVAYDFGGRALPAERTTPESLDLQSMLSKMRSSDCRSAVMEVSSHALVQKRVWGVDFDVGVFTNLSQDHLDYHDSMEQYFAAKSLLFNGGAGVKRELVAVVNADDEWGRRLLQAGGRWAHEISYGVTEDADVRAVDISENENGSTFTLLAEGRATPITLAAIGRFNISNALAAAAAGLALKIDVEIIAAALSSFRSAPGRLEEIENNLGLRIFVDYAHTDDALRNVLATLRGIAHGRIVTVFGCGGNRDQEKRPLMAAAVDELSDHAVITSDNPRKENPAEIIEQIKRGFSSTSAYTVVEDREEAIAAALGMLVPGDILLVAGKGHEKYQQFADTIIPFDDCEVLRTLLEEMES